MRDAKGNGAKVVPRVEQPVGSAQRSRRRRIRGDKCEVWVIEEFLPSVEDRHNQGGSQ